MTAHILTGTEISTGRRKPSALVAEYEAKRALLPEAMTKFGRAQDDLKSAATLAGEWGWKTLDVGRVSERDLDDSLLRSAWRHLYKLYDFDLFATAKDKDRIERMFENPVPFTMDNVAEWFGTYVQDPRGSILRGLAEVFTGLDPSFKSHEKVRIGVAALPKRIIMPSVTGYGRYGRQRIEDVLNALAAYQGKPLLSNAEITLLLKDGDALRLDGEIPNPLSRRDDDQMMPIVGRDIWLRTFQNGNGHLFFGSQALRDINMALAEFYGDILPDASNEQAKKLESTAVAKDLQYYPTPVAVVERLLSGMPSLKDRRVLEPSCGCGRFLDNLRKAGAKAIGYEVDAGRVARCRDRGHPVVQANFLEVTPSEEFDFVVMNPPFYGKHYAKHVRHAFEFLKPGGGLYAILPISARYDHGLLDDLNPRWDDLPVGSFSESGTNINTTVMTAWRQS